MMSNYTQIGIIVEIPPIKPTKNNHSLIGITNEDISNNTQIDRNMEVKE